VLAVLAVAGVVAALLVAGGGGDGEGEAEEAIEREVFLETVASAGPAPFTPSLQSDDGAGSTSSSTSTSASTTTTTQAAGGGTGGDGDRGRRAQGPFGGTGDNRLCDRELLVEFLTDGDNRAIAREWARVVGVRVEDIPAFVRDLVPTTLTADARVTNHRWDGRRAVPYQAVLQAGTAVLVDTRGELVARCRCGNPLLPPVEVTRPVYTGPRWEGFDPTVVVIVVAAPAPIYPPGGVAAPTSTTSTTTATLADADDAVRRIREPFEACARMLAQQGEGFFVTAADIEAMLPQVRYNPTLVDAATRTYRVEMVIPDTTVESGAQARGATATWEVNLSTGAVTPVDDNARQASGCPGLG
jgi:hypothetical protein